MCRLVILVLLLQVLLAFGTRCVVDRSTSTFGTCVKKEDCLTGSISICGSSGLYCCPTNSIETSIRQKRSSNNCGYTPLYGISAIVYDFRIPPDEYSWITSLEYNNDTNSRGICAGSVISSLYVITAARCLVGKVVQLHGEVTAVRLVTPASYENLCDYGGSDCESYQRFAVIERIVHAEYRRTASNVAVNDIGLLKLNKEIQFTHTLRPVCLPDATTEPLTDIVLNVGGWGKTLQWNSKLAKRVEPQQVLNETECYWNSVSNETHICTRGDKSFISDFGGPLMRRSYRRMVLEGIRSDSTLDGSDTLSTRIRNYLSWIEQNVK